MVEKDYIRYKDDGTRKIISSNIMTKDSGTPECITFIDCIWNMYRYDVDTKCFYKFSENPLNKNCHINTIKYIMINGQKYYNYDVDVKEQYKYMVERYINNDINTTKAYIKTYTEEDAMKKETITKITHFNDDERTYLNYAFNGDFIKKVIFNNPATIIIWKDGTKTVVKCGEDEPYNPEFGMAMAICKKVLGNKGNYYNVFSKWLPDISWHYYYREFVNKQVEKYGIELSVTLRPTVEQIEKAFPTFEDIKKFEAEVKEELGKEYNHKEFSERWNKRILEANMEDECTEEGEVIANISEVVNATVSNIIKKVHNGSYNEIEMSNDSLSEQGKELIEGLECTEDGCPIPVIPAEETAHPVINLENGYAPHYDTNPKKNDDDEWIEIKPEDHLGDNSYERWKVNTPFHEKIKERRKALGYSHKDMGAKVGCPQSNFSFWERGRWYPKSEKVRQKLAEVLNFQLDELYEVTEVNGEIQTTIREEKKK